MDTSDKVTHFQKRWNIRNLDNDDFEHFKNHILYSVDNILGKFLLFNFSICDKFAYFMGLPVKPRSVIVGKMTWENEYNNCLFAENIVYITIINSKTIIQLITALQYLFWGLEDFGSDAKFYIDDFIVEVQNALSLSPSMNVRIVKSKSGVILYPSGAKLLDDKLVNDNLLWLENYPTVLQHFEEALVIYSSRDINKYRNLLDNLRFAIEQLLRKILNNRRAFENQKELLLRWIKEKNINQQIINMFSELLFQNYRIYQNENVKHGDYWSPDEIEFIIYLTGTFMRMLIQLNNNTEK